MPHYHCAIRCAPLVNIRCSEVTCPSGNNAAVRNIYRYALANRANVVVDMIDEDEKEEAREEMRDRLADLGLDPDEYDDDELDDLDI